MPAFNRATEAVLRGQASRLGHTLGRFLPAPDGRQMSARCQRCGAAGFYLPSDADTINGPAITEECARVTS